MRNTFALELTLIQGSIAKARLWWVEAGGAIRVRVPTSDVRRRVVFGYSFQRCQMNLAAHFRSFILVVVLHEVISFAANDPLGIGRNLRDADSRPAPLAMHGS